MNDFSIARQKCVATLQGIINIDSSKEVISKTLQVVKVGIVRLLLKCSNFLSALVYDIDPKASLEALHQLENKIKIINKNTSPAEAQALLNLYQKARKRFNELFPDRKKDCLTDPDADHWEYQKAVFEASQKQNSNLQELLAGAMKDQKIEAALWLVQNKGAVLPKQVPREQATLLAWLQKATSQKPAIPENLDHFALDIGYGYKAANRFVMRKKLGDVKLNSISGRIPPCMGISDYELKAYIYKFYPELENEWKTFLAEGFDNQLKTSFLTCKPSDPIPSLPISQKGKEILAGIQDKMRRVFSEHDYHSLQLQEWLEKEHPKAIIVRSTGREDSETNSNPGGNESIPFVKNISESIGVVLTSYVSEKSISQRLLAGDKTVLTEETLFFPVLIEEMVLEEEGEIPRSGVLFVGQPDKAKGSVFIQTGLGNNHGIVSGQVAVDTFNINNGIVHPTIRKKETRFTCDKRNKLVKVENEGIKTKDGDDIRTSQSLTDSIALDVAKIAQKTSQFYSQDEKSLKALEMEYSIKLNEKGSHLPVSYILQNRPLLLSNSTSSLKKPSYIHMKTVSEMVPMNQKVSVKVLIDTKNEVQRIQNHKQILFVDTTVADALGYYTLKSEKPKVIVVRKSAPSTSHESVALRSLGVTVIVVNDRNEYAKIKDFHYQATLQNPLLIDVQRGFVISTTGVNNSAVLIKEGLISYPMPLEISISQQPLVEGHHLDADAHFKKQYARHLKTLEEDWGNLRDILIKDKNDLYQTKPKQANAKSLNELFEIMATDNTKDRADAKRALATVLSLLHAYLHKTLKTQNPILIPYAQPLYHLFACAIKLSIREIVPGFNKYEGQTLERLYSLKFLEAIVFQQPGEDVIGGFSFATFLRLNKTQTEIIRNSGIQISKTEDLILVPCIKYGKDAAYSGAVFEKWKQFLRELQPKKRQELLDLINEMRSHHVFEPWLNIMFAPSWSTGKSAVILSNLYDSLQLDHQALQWLSANRKKIPNQNAIDAIGAMKDVKEIQKEIADLKSLYLNSFGYDSSSREGIRKRLCDSNQLGGLAYVQFIHDSVNIYDLFIKQVIENEELSRDIQLKAELFSELLLGYFEMMKSVLLTVDSKDAASMLNIQESLNSMIKIMRGESIHPFDSFIEKLQNGTEYTFRDKEKTSIGFQPLCKNTFNRLLSVDQLQKQFDVDPDFCVAALAVGSRVNLDFNILWPERLNQYFTTFHQCMENVCNHLNMKLGLNQDVLSGQPKEVCSSISNVFKTSPSYIQKVNENVEATYQISLREHAATLIVSYDPQNLSKGLDLTVQMIGEHEHDRWYQMALVGAYLGNCGIKGLTCTNGVASNLNWKQNYAKINHVEFSLHLSDSFSQLYCPRPEIEVLTCAKAPAVGRSEGPQYYQYGGPSDRSNPGALAQSKPQFMAAGSIDKIIQVLHWTVKDLSVSQSFDVKSVIKQLELLTGTDQIQETIFSMTLWGLSALLPLVKEDTKKLSAAIMDVIEQLISKEVNCKNLRGEVDVAPLYDTLINHLELLESEDPVQFVDLIKNLKNLPISLNTSNPELASQIEKYSKKKNEQYFQQLLNQKKWFASTHFIQTEDQKKEFIEALKKLTPNEHYMLFYGFDQSIQNRNLMKPYLDALALPGILKLSSQFQRICSEMGTRFKALYSFKHYENNRVEVVLDYSLGSFTIICDPSHPENGINIRFNNKTKEQGIDRKWYKVSLIGAYLSNCGVEGLSAPDNHLKPELHWEKESTKVTDVEFNLHLSDKFIRFEDLVERLHQTLMPHIKLHNEAVFAKTSEIIKDLKMSSSALNLNFFSSTFWGLDIILPSLDPVKLQKPLSGIIQQLTNQGIDCSIFDVDGKSLYDILVEQIKRLETQAPQQFIELMKELKPHLDVIAKKNNKLSVLLKKHIADLPFFIDFLNLLDKNEWLEAINLAEKFPENQWEKKVIENLQFLDKNQLFCLCQQSEKIEYYVHKIEDKSLLKEVIKIKEEHLNFMTIDLPQIDIYLGELLTHISAHKNKEFNKISDSKCYNLFYIEVKMLLEKMAVLDIKKLINDENWTILNNTKFDTHQEREEFEKQVHKLKESVERRLSQKQEAPIQLSVEDI